MGGAAFSQRGDSGRGEVGLAGAIEPHERAEVATFAVMPGEAGVQGARPHHNSRGPGAAATGRPPGLTPREGAG